MQSGTVGIGHSLVIMVRWYSLAVVVRLGIIVRGAYPGMFIVGSIEKNGIDQADPSA